VKPPNTKSRAISGIIARGRRSAAEVLTMINEIESGYKNKGNE